MKTSEILRLAADKHLSHDSDTYSQNEKRTFSCNAVRTACISLGEDCIRHLDFLSSLGCPDSGWAFDEFENTYDKQGARFLWLDFAALVAEDMGD
jgi:hypothetical protein